MIMLMTIAMFTSMIFIQMNNPLSMGLMLFIQTILICMMTGMLTTTFWFPYILFLVFLGGMLILFMYIISLASNEMFNLISKWTLLSTIPLIMILLFFKNNMFNNMSNMDMMSNNLNQMMMMNETLINLNKLYNFPTNLMNMLLMIYLLITLIGSVKITKINQGPMRKTN